MEAATTDTTKSRNSALFRKKSGVGEITRRALLQSGAAFMALSAFPRRASALMTSQHVQAPKTTAEIIGDRLVTKDGTKIRFKDWGSGRPIVFSHGWPLNADAWDAQMLYFGQRGFRVIAHDRRGHGCSDQAAAGHEMNTYADDLSDLFDALNLRDVILVGHSTGGGEVVRYTGRHTGGRLSKMVLISAIPPLRLRTSQNPGGAPLAAFDELRTSIAHDRSQFLKDLSGPFYGFNKPGAKVSVGIQDAFWRAGMQASADATFYGIKPQSETDFTIDLRNLRLPSLVIHGTDDQLVPVRDSAILTAKLIRHSELALYEGAPHGLIMTHADRVNNDILRFITS